MESETKTKKNNDELSKLMQDNNKYTAKLVVLKADEVASRQSNNSRMLILTFIFGVSVYQKMKFKYEDVYLWFAATDPLNTRNDSPGFLRNADAAAFNNFSPNRFALSMYWPWLNNMLPGAPLNEGYSVMIRKLIDTMKLTSRCQLGGQMTFGDSGEPFTDPADVAEKIALAYKSACMASKVKDGDLGGRSRAQCIWNAWAYGVTTPYAPPSGLTNAVDPTTVALSRVGLLDSYYNPVYSMWTTFDAGETDDNTDLEVASMPEIFSEVFKPESGEFIDDMGESSLLTLASTGVVGLFGYWLATKSPQEQWNYMFKESYSPPRANDCG
jgi:hypothetical protein